MPASPDAVGTSRALRLADRWFRVAGLATIAVLAVTALLLVADVEAWWVPFVVAHLLALIALLPLALILLAHSLRESGSPMSLVRRHPLPAALVSALAITVALSLLNFEGNREVRRIANLSSVALVLVLVVRYLRWSRLAVR